MARFKLLLKLAFSCFLLLLLGWKANPAALIDKISIIPHYVIAQAFLVHILLWGLAAYKWNVLLRHVRYTKLLRLSFVGQLYSLILPGQIAGELIKAYRLGKGKAEAEYLAASVLVDKLTGLIGLLLVSAYGLWTTKTSLPREISTSICVLMALFLVSLYSVKIPYIYRILHAFLNKIPLTIPRLGGLSGRIVNLIDAWCRYLSHPLRLIYVLSLGALFQLGCVFYITILAQPLGIFIPFGDWCWIFGIVSLAVLIPVSVGGIGVREGAFASILSLYDIPIDKSIALSLAVFAVALLGAGIGGLIELFGSFLPPSTKSNHMSRYGR